jgi:hypothetical protein
MSFGPAVTLFSVAACVALAVAGNVRAGTYHVVPTGDDGGGNGSCSRPWATLRHAIGSVPDDGSEIVLLPGLYREGVYVARRFNKTVRIRAEEPYRARWTSPPGRHRILYIENGANLVFSGIEMFGQPGAKDNYLIQIAGEQASRVLLENCIIHDSYSNDLIKINDRAHEVVVRGSVLYNQNDHGGDELLDINTVTDVSVEDCIFFNDFAGSGRPLGNQSHSFVVVKNSGSTPNVTRRIAFRRNVFLNWEGKTDQCYLLLGEDGKPFLEAQDVLIENNLFIHNSPVRFWGTLLLKGGLRNVVFRANTVVGHPNIRWSGAYAAVCQRIGENPPMGDMAFTNNIWCDATGQMPRFSDGKASLFAPQSKQVLESDLYWNGGKAIPTEPQDVLVPERDRHRHLADPRLGNPDEGVTLPRWNAEKGQFLSDETTIRGEFERLVGRYASLGMGSGAIDAADPATMPGDDILGNRREPRPDIGCFERQSGE